MNNRHAKTLAAIFAQPTSASIRFTDIEPLIVALGGTVREGAGSRVSLRLRGGVKTHIAHIPVRKPSAIRSRKSATGSKPLE